MSWYLICICLVWTKAASFFQNVRVKRVLKPSYTICAMSSGQMLLQKKLSRQSRYVDFFLLEFIWWFWPFSMLLQLERKVLKTLKIALILQNWKWSKIKMNSSHAFRTFRQSFSGRGTIQLPNTPISQIIRRSLSSSQVSTALRPFYFLVHPDLFGRWPQEQAVNEASLKQLKSYLKSVFSLCYFVFKTNFTF